MHDLCFGWYRLKVKSPCSLFLFSFCVVDHMVLLIVFSTCIVLLFFVIMLKILSKEPANIANFRDTFFLYLCVHGSFLVQCPYTYIDPFLHMPIQSGIHAFTCKNQFCDDLNPSYLLSFNFFFALIHFFSLILLDGVWRKGLSDPLLL